MKLVSTATAFLAGISTVASLLIPPQSNSLPRRESEAKAITLSPSDVQLIERDNEEAYTYLEKRRGGGGGGGGGGRGGGSSSGSSGSSRSSGSSGGSGGSSRSPGSSGSSGSSGGRGSTSSRSSSSPSFGGGRYYAGGASAPFSAGSRSPRGIAPYLLGGAALGIFPGLLLYGAYAYPYTTRYGYRNSTSNRNESLPVTCVCAQYSACGCDDNDNSTFISSLLPNGQNTSQAVIANINGTRMVVINGTLPNGTDDSADEDSTVTTGAGIGMRQTLAEASGFWLMGAVVALIVWGL